MGCGASKAGPCASVQVPCTGKAREKDLKLFFFNCSRFFGRLPLDANLCMSYM